MTRGVIPAFEAVEGQEAAQALSEPFLRNNDYEVFSQADLAEAEPLAVGYLS